MCIILEHILIPYVKSSEIKLGPLGQLGLEHLDLLLEVNVLIAFVDVQLSNWIQSLRNIGDRGALISSEVQLQ